MSDVRCADASAAVGEQLAGTAVHVEDWLLVELRGTWPRDVSAALAEGEPAAGVLGAWLERTPRSRLLFIRRPGAPTGMRSAFVVRSTEVDASVRRIAFDDLDTIDLDGGELVDLPLVLVCGHGTRDACCALRGNAVHGALTGHLPADALWLSSHQGGHRFAANVLVLPVGIQLGRVSTADAVGLVQESLAGRIPLEHYRGRTVHPPRVQAAESAVREAAGLRDVRDLVLVADDGARVELGSPDGRRFLVDVDVAPGPVVPASCGVEPESQPVLRARIA